MNYRPCGPDFFILGAAKSGTTSLYHYLGQHPDVFFPEEKEPTFFCEEFQVIRNPITYFDYYRAGSAYRMRGDASHAYLTSPGAAAVLKGLFPRALFIVILRHPADRAYSLYVHMRRSGLEWCGSFEQALALEEERVLSDRFKRANPQYYYNFLYFRSGLYAPQIARYLALFDRAQFYFLSLNQLKTSPRETVRALCGFLGLDPSFTPDLTASNRGERIARFPVIQVLWDSGLKPLLIARGLETLVRKGAVLFRRYNSIPTPRINPQTRALLVERYRPDLAMVKEQTGIDL